MPATTTDFALHDLPGFGLAMLLIVLFMFGYSYFSKRQLPRLRPQPTLKPSVPSAPLPSRMPAAEPIPVAIWLPQLFDRAAHIIILGGSGSGKTRTTRGLVRYIVEQRREQVVILDPKANRDTWMGLSPLIHPTAIDQAMQLLLAEFQRRLDRNPTLTEAEAARSFTRVWVVVDEVSFVRDNCKSWEAFLKRISSMARSLKLHLIIVNQSERVEELGLKGRGDLLANFARVDLSAAVWDGDPVRVEISAQTICGAWRNHFPEAYRGRPLPAEAAYPLVCQREPGGSQEPVPVAGTAAAGPEPAFDDAEPAGYMSGTGSVTEHAQSANHSFGGGKEEKIRQLDAQGYSRNQIAREIGGRRSDALTLIAMVLG